MTYIDYINQFWKTNRSVGFSPNEALLYFYLLDGCNIRGWQNPFEYPSKTIVLATGISEKTVIEVRNRLQQKDLTALKSGKKNAKSPVYYLLDESKMVSREVNKEVSEGVSKTVNINNKIKGNKAITLPRACVGELSPEDSFFDKFLEERYQELKSNQPWAETVTTDTRSSGYDELTIEAFYECLKQFFMKLQDGGETTKLLKGAMSHFVRWLKLKLNNKKDGKSKRTDTDSETKIKVRTIKL